MSEQDDIDAKLAELAAPFERSIKALTTMIRDFNAITVDQSFHRFYPPAVSSKINLELSNLKMALKALTPELCLSCGGAKCHKCTWTGINPAGKNDP